MPDIFMLYSFNHNWRILLNSRTCFYIVFKTSSHCPLDWKLPFSFFYTYWIKFISKKRIRGIRRKTNNLKTKIEKLIQREKSLTVTCPQKFRIKISSQNLENFYVMKTCKSSLECSLKKAEVMLLRLWRECDFIWVMNVTKV